MRRVSASCSGVAAVYMPSSVESKLRKPRDVRGMKRIELRLHLLDRGLRAESPDMEEAVASPGAVGFLLRRERQRNPELNAIARAGVAVVALIEERESGGITPTIV